MELILNKDVQNLGFKDDIVTVKNGYGKEQTAPTADFLKPHDKQPTTSKD